MKSSTKNVPIERRRTLMHFIYFLKTLMVVMLLTGCISESENDISEESESSSDNEISLEQPPTISEVRLIDPSDDSIIQTFSHNETVSLNVADLPDDYYLEAVPGENFVIGEGSIKFYGATNINYLNEINISNESPYLLFSNNGGLFHMTPGSYGKHFRAYSELDGQGVEGPLFSVYFNMADDDPLPPQPPTISEVRLIDPSDDSIIQTFSNNEVVNLNVADLPQDYYLEAVPSENFELGEGSIKFYGATNINYLNEINTDNTSPYLIFADNGGLFHMTPGSYGKHFRAYSESDGQGIEGPLFSVYFNMTDSAYSPPPPVNTAPQISASGSIGICVGDTRSWDISAIDAEEDDITFSLNIAPEYISFIDNGNGTATITAFGDPENPGYRSIRIIATDSHGAYSVKDIGITVNNSCP